MKQRTAPTNLRCPHCQSIMPIQRKQALLKKEGHIKHLWCFRCKAVTPHREEREY